MAPGDEKTSERGAGAEEAAAERLGVNDAPAGDDEEVRPAEDQTGAGGSPGAPPARTPGMGA